MKHRPLLCSSLVVLCLLATQCGDDAARPAPPVPPPAPAGAAAPPAQDPAPPAIPDGAERVRLSIGGALHGRLEPCGCASGQLGGLARRFFHLQQADYDLLIEGGDLVTGITELDFQKFYKSVEILFGMRRPYHVLGVGPRDLELKLDEWAGLLTGMGVPVVASDLECVDAGLPWPARPFVEQVVRTQTVRVASLTMALPAAVADLQPPRLRLLEPAVAWQAALQGAAESTLRVLLLHTGPERIAAVVPTLQPPPDLVIGVTDAHGEPVARPQQLGGVPVVYSGIRGRMLVDVSLARLAEGPRVGYRIVPLEGSKTRPGMMEDKDVKAAILQHRHQVKEDRVLQALAGQLPTANGASFVGSAKCKDCHPEAFAIWERSKHGHAWRTLVDAERNPDRYGWPVTAYPDCVGCHTVGYRQQTGFVDAATTPELTDVGCEECHGAGSAHVKAPMKNRLGPVGNGIAATTCTRCHDFEQSPDFDYGTRWRTIEHGRK